MAHREIDYSKMADKNESRYPDKDTNWVVPLGPNVNGFEGVTTCWRLTWINSGT